MTGGGGSYFPYMMCLCLSDLGKVWLLSRLHHFWPFWRGLQCHRLGDCSTDCSKIRSQNAIPIALEMIAKTARGYFEIWRETRVLASSWKFPKSTYIVALLHSSAVIKLSVDWEKHHALQKGLFQFFAVIFFTHRYQDLKRTFPFHWLEIFVCDNFNTKYLNLLFWCHRTAHPFDCFCWSGNTTFR